MLRLSGLIVAIGLMLIAGAVGGAAYLLLGLARTEAAVVALAAFTALALYYLAIARARDRREAARQIVDLSRGIADLARQLGLQERRFGTLERRTEIALQKLSAMHEAPVVDTAVGAAAVTQVEASPVREPETPAPAVDETTVTALIRQAIASEGIEIHLQPIVTLPQRKVCCYEAFARLRGPNGELLRPPDFLAVAERAGLIAEIDCLMAFGCVRVVRRLTAGGSNIAIFCNFSPATLTDRAAFGRIADFMDANRALAPHLVFEFALASWRAMQAREQEALSILAGFGFQFSLDHVTDLRFDPQELADRRCAYVKVPAALLLGLRREEGGAKAAAEFPAALAGAGIKLIAEKIEAETTAMDLIDLDVRLGQGMLFSAPRPVRPEATPGRTESSAPPTPATPH
jgi:cyclic-di-GMP phosphodiesterase, flagellum assembly factor TipF